MSRTNVLVGIRDGRGSRLRQLDYAIVATGRVVELKAVSAISKMHRAQLAAYLRTTGVDRGLILNFPPEGDVQTEFVEAASVE